MSASGQGRERPVGSMSRVQARPTVGSASVARRRHATGGSDMNSLKRRMRALRAGSVPVNYDATPLR
ncbi:hypothetical protein [Burkholderia sp. SCN-KJ]|uniref:hypothetical protein n=1 Tax=Burkholderia sp. SCN-KJ TaxID=2969248 RepID=UPI00214F8F3B|nr:hypothetical protein [Burkholderia sp. SCN-KJ]MCR4468208.1 hypothetical protein [Burkholderia sp. SCN-KJ]